MSNKKRPTNIFTGSTSSLAGVGLIAIFAFFGFRAMLTGLSQNIALEAIIAAFGALFVLLPTKFLMEQESESRLKGEKRSVVFRSNLDDYKGVASEIIKVLRDKKLTAAELSTLRQNHAFMVLLGSTGAIECSRAFIIKCQEIMDGCDTDNMEGVVLDAQQEQDLWDLALEFLGAAREGLKLSEDDFVLSDEKAAFRALNKTQSEIEEKFVPRQELIEGLNGWAKMRKIDNAQKNKIEKFINELKANNGALKEKFTRTAISLRDMENPKQKRILYINAINKNNEINISFAAVKDQDFISKTKKELGNLSSRTDSRSDGWGLSVSAPDDSVLPGTSKKIGLIAKNFALFFREESNQP